MTDNPKYNPPATTKPPRRFETLEDALGHYREIVGTAYRPAEDVPFLTIEERLAHFESFGSDEALRAAAANELSRIRSEVARLETAISEVCSTTREDEAAAASAESNLSAINALPELVDYSRLVTETEAAKKRGAAAARNQQFLANYAESLGLSPLK